MEKTYYFVSDLHLGLQSAEKERIKENEFIAFLDYCKKDAYALYILGDLFDYWFEYKRVIQRGFFKTLTKLNELAESGIEIHYLIGNHDFMHRDFWKKEIGAHLYYDTIEKDFNGKKFFLGHGDGLIDNDLGYKILKKILRNKILQGLFYLIHPDLAIWIAGSTSKKSRDYTAKKDYGENDSLFEVAKKKIDSGFDYVLFGHSHIRANKKYKNGHYINLGTWLQKPCYGKFSTSFEVVDWDQNS